MALILSVLNNACVNWNDRLEMTLNATVVGMPLQRYSFNVSYKKHATSSYKTNYAPPPTADVNTLVNLSERDFMAAFTEYGRLVAARMTQQDHMIFNPSAPANRVVTRQIAFSSDAVRLGGNVHCFPFNISPGQTPLCISLSRTAFDNFKIVAKFLFRIGVIQAATARTSWTAIDTLVRGRIGQPNELLSAVEVHTLETRLRAGVGLQALVQQDQGALRRAQNAGNVPNPNPGRPPFRGW